jgi:hypothetical protein
MLEYPAVKKNMSVAACVFASHQRGDTVAQRDEAENYQRDNADAPARQSRQCRETSATMTRNKREKIEVTKAPTNFFSDRNFGTKVSQSPPP